MYVDQGKTSSYDWLLISSLEQQEACFLPLLAQIENFKGKMQVMYKQM
jgi:hypothetical protein